MRNFLSCFFLFLTSYLFSQSCLHTLYMTDTYGDGWNGNYASVSVNGVTVISNVTLNSGLGPATVTFNATAGQTIRVWRSITGSWTNECQIRVTSSTGATVIALQTLQPGSPTSGGSTGSAQCSAGGGGSATLVPYSGFNSVNCGTNTTLYDHGGQFGNYSNNANGYTVLNNGGSAVISLNGTSSGESCCDRVRIYLGIGTGGALIGTYWMNSNIPNINSSPGQPLTVQFLSDGSVTGSGFTINVTYSGNCSSGAPPDPSSISSTSATICTGQSVTLTANGSVGTTYWFTNGCNTVGQIGTGNSITVNPNTTTTYWARNFNSGFWSSGCAQYTVSVTSLPQPPNQLTYTINCGVSPTLTAVGGAGNYQWWSNSNATGLLWSGQTYNPGALNQNTTFWVTTSNGVCNSTTSAYQVNTTALTQPTANNTSVNCGSSTTLSITNAASNVNWYTNSNGTGQVGSGSTFTTPQLTTNTTYYVGSGSGACATPLTPVTVSVNNNLAQPTSNNTSINCGQTSTLTASGGTGTYAWYSNSNATGQLGTGANFTTPQLTTNTTYYVTSTAGSATTQSVGFNNCYAINNWSLQHLNGGNGSVNTTGSPNSIQLTGPDGTGGNSYTLYQITVAATGTISWNWTVSHNDCSYDTYGYRINGTDYPLATCSASGSTSVNVTAGQTFAFYGRSHDGCCGTFTATISNFNKPCSGQACFSQPVAVTVTVNPLTAPVVNNTSINCGSTATINASGNGTITWYQNSNLTGSVATGNQWTTPTLTTSTTYYLQSTSGSCQSSSTPVTVTVNPLASPTVSGNTSLCVGNNTTLSASGGSSYTWFANSNGTGQLGTGSNYTTPNLNSNTTYYVQSGTAPQTQTAVFNINSFGQLINMNSNCGGGSYYNGCSGSTGFSWVSSIPAGATITSVQIQLSVGVECQAGTRSTTLNGVGGPTFNTIGNCSCSGSVNPIITLNMNVANYIANGTNQFLITNPPSCFGLFSGSGGLPGLFARVTVTYQTGSACVSQLTAVPITVNASPTITATATNPTICQGQSTQLNASGATTYSWSGGAGNGSQISVSPNATTTYTVTGQVAGGCQGQTQLTITVNPLPNSNAGPDIIGSVTCGKDNINLQATSLSAGQTGAWQIISGPNGIASLNTPTTLFQGQYGATYTLQWNVTNTTTGCVGTDQMILTFNQPNAASLSGLIGNGDLLWCGLTSNDWSTSTNWYQNMGSYYQRMSGAAQPVISSQVFTLNQATGGICIGSQNPTLSITSNAYDVFVNPGITLNLTNDSLNIAHDLNNSGTIVASTGLVNFTGSLNSNINGSGSTQLFNMRVNKSAGSTLTLNQPVSVTNNLNMVQGNIFTTTTNLLTLGSSSANPGTLVYNTGTIVGPFRRYFSNSTTNGNGGLFPVGTQTYNRYSDFNFTSTPGTNQFLTVQYKTGAPLVGGTPLYNGLPLVVSGSLIQNYSIDGYWEVTPTSNNYSSSICQTPYNVTLFANNLTGMNTPQICRIIKSPGSNHTTWQACGAHVSIPGNANAQAFLITSNNTQGFSWFNIGTPNSQALPVELLSFDGECQNEFIKLNWSTSTEHNSSYFEVQKSIDGISWRSLTTLSAAGNSTQKLDYTTSDFEKIEGNNYYKLVQFDYDGQSKEYGPINISCESVSKGYFSVFPNPSSGQFQLVLNDKNLLGESEVIVNDTKGSQIFNKIINVKPGINTFLIEELKNSNGLYYIYIRNSSVTTSVIKIEIR